MNAQNAQSIGYEDGRRYLRNATLQNWQPSPAWKTGLLEDAHNRAFYSYRCNTLKTIDLYVKGWEEAIESFKAEKEREQREAEARAAIPHDPSSRFCMCSACRA